MDQGKAVDGNMKRREQVIVIPEEDMVIALTSTAYGPGYGYLSAYAMLAELLKASK